MTAFIRSRRQRRGLTFVVLLSLVAAMFAFLAAPADAGVNGGCNGSADFTADNVGAYGPDNDTTDNAIIVPKADGNVAQWEGNVPGNNENFSGKVEVQLGPIWITVGDWGFPNFNGENSLDGREDSGDYNMDEFWSAVDDAGFSKSWIQGIYNARADHSADGVNCDAQFFVKFEGNATDSPLVIISIVILAISIVLLIIAGRRKRSGGRLFKGRPILVIIATLLMAITIAILLQQFCKVPLNNTTVIILPIVLIIIGLVIAKIAPFGGATPAGDLPNGLAPNGNGADGRSGQPPQPPDVDTSAVDEAIDGVADDVASGDIFEDGFESGDTSSWGK